MANVFRNQLEPVEELMQISLECGLSIQEGSDEIKQPDMTETRRCRLCAVTEHGDGGKWVKTADTWLDTSENIDQFLKGNFARGLLVQLLDLTGLQHVCDNCFTSLQLLQNFIKRIIKGQEQLRKLFQGHDLSKDASADAVQTRKRGRPRKDPNKPVITKEVPLSNIEARARRPVRPPTRYGNEFNLTDASNEVSVSNDSQQLEERAVEKVSLLGISSDAGINEARDNQPCESGSKTAKLAESDGNSKVVENNDKDKVAVTDDINEEMVQPVAEDLNDTSFNLKSFYSRIKSRRRKRGRPKKWKEHDFKCDLCEKVYTAYASLMYHRLSHHETTPDFQCTLCKKSFAHKALLANHMFTHSSVRPFICDFDECNASFRSRGSLYNHKKAVHESKLEKMFSCENCGLQFTFKWALQAHQKIHTGEKPYSCAYCDKRFSHRGNLKEHLRTHTKEKPYFCDIPECDKCFTTASQLRSHKMRHLSRNYPFLCEECGKRFSQQTALITHIKSHKEDSQTFSDESNYRKHKKTHPKLKDDIDKSNEYSADTSTIQETCSSDFALVPFGSELREDITGGAVSSILPPSAENTTSDSSNGQRNANVDIVPPAESFVQILTEEELSALGASVGTSSEDKHIVFLYQTNDLFPVSEEGNQAIQVHENASVVLDEVHLPL